MKNIKTTIGGILAGGSVIVNALMEAFSNGTLDGKHGLQLVAGIGIVILGVFSKDKNVTGGSVAQSTISNPPTL
jgi:hypothetical protein